MNVAPVFVPSPVYGHPLELTLLQRLRDRGPELVEQYLAARTMRGVAFVSRDAAKRIFPEFLESPTLHNRYADAAASAIADAARRTLLALPVSTGKDAVVILTGAPASGKTGSVGSALFAKVGIQHETILTSLERARVLVDDVLAAGRRLSFTSSIPTTHASMSSA